MDRREALKRTAWIVGGAIATPSIVSMLNSCKGKPTIDWNPAFFTQEQGILVSQIAEIMIPRTDTPGAKEAGVPAFVDGLIKDCYTKEDQDRFMEGLKAFNDGAKAAHGDFFVELDPEEQLEYLGKVHVAAIEEKKKAEPGAKKPFILTAKELIMLGYFTSEPGATLVLQYEPVPGSYKGCIPLSEAGNGKTWAT